MEEIVDKHHEEVAGIILEPVCQGAAGIRIYSAKYVTKVRALCDKYNLLMIADEIAVGFGRTGFMFACQKAGVSPDIMTIGKGVTSGYLPLSASVVNDKVYDAFRNGNTLFHGHTYCGNPLATAVALAALDVYEEMDILKHIEPAITLMETRTAALAALLPGSFFNHVGMISMFEVSEADGGAARAAAIGAHALNSGVMVRPLGTSVYLWPPLVSTADELNEMFDALHNAIAATR
jgi:adenosylmethionine-8-amino-7-oxononanoate aminotransferase